MRKVNVMLVASGSGTDAKAIMTAQFNDCLSNACVTVLVSTKSGASCIEKARTLDVDHVTVDRKECGSDEIFNAHLRSVVEKYDIDLIFLVGCIVRIDPDIFPNIPIYNIHPADTEKYGGDGMYGLKVHEYVLHDVLDQIERGKKSLKLNRFFTYPTVHEVVYKYDSGMPLLTGMVEIPETIIAALLRFDLEIRDGAKELQKIVLPYEWLMLPAAVEMAALRILEKRK